MSQSSKGTALMSSPKPLAGDELTRDKMPDHREKRMTPYRNHNAYENTSLQRDPDDEGTLVRLSVSTDDVLGKQ